MIDPILLACCKKHGHDWDGHTCMHCGMTSFDEYRERIAELEAVFAELRQKNAELHGFDSWSDMMSVIEKNKKTEGE